MTLIYCIVPASEDRHIQMTQIPTAWEVKATMKPAATMGLTHPQALKPTTKLPQLQLLQNPQKFVRQPKPTQAFLFPPEH